MITGGSDDKRKFIILYEKYSRLMMKVALNILHDSFLSEDAVHDAFVNVAKNMEKTGSVESLKTKNYLIVVTKNASINIYRKRSIRIKREIFVDESGEEPASYMETDMDNSVLEVLKSLPVMYRDVFLLKYSSRLENKEIAQILRISEENVRKRIERGKIMVQNMLMDWRRKKMGHINVTDEWLYQHMPLVNEAMVNELEKQTDHDYQFSKRFENKMKKIIRKESHMGNKKWLKKVNVRAAAAMACIIIFLFTVTVSAYADKISFFETVRILWEDSFIYSYFTEETDRLNVKKPGYVPAGYEMLIEDANTAVASFIYQDDAGRQLICLQHHVSDGSEITFDSEYDLEDHIKITGGVIEMRWYSDGHVYCYLEYMENVFTLYADNLDNNDVKKIFTEWIHN